MAVIVMYWKLLRRLDIDACIRMDTKATVRNFEAVIYGKLREWLSVGNSYTSSCVKDEHINIVYFGKKTKTI